MGRDIEFPMTKLGNALSLAQALIAHTQICFPVLQRVSHAVDRNTYLIELIGAAVEGGPGAEFACADLLRNRRNTCRTSRDPAPAQSPRDRQGHRQCGQPDGEIQECAMIDRRNNAGLVHAGERVHGDRAADRNGVDFTQKRAGTPIACARAAHSAGADSVEDALIRQ